MMHWGYILGGLSILSIVSAAVVTIVNTQLPAYATPENSTFAYLKDIGFQAFYFFGVLMGVCAFFLISNSKDRKMDAKAVVVKLSLFSTEREYTYGTIVICVVSIIFYALFW